MSSHPGSIGEWLDRVPLGRRIVRHVAEETEHAYLVGGTIRDALLGRESYDLDITVEGNAMSLARRVADRMQGAYVPLDRERDVARVVVRVGDIRHHFDFAGLRADDILADLWARDYTVNAMAVKLGELEELIDPTGGQSDLAAGMLRAVCRDAFEEDPVRILRGVRLRGELGFALTSDTEALAREWLPALQRVTAERIRDELVRILALDDASDSLAYAQILGVLGVILPELESADFSPSEAIDRVRELEGLFVPWVVGADQPSPSTQGAVRGAFAPHCGSLVGHWREELTVGRMRWVMLKLAALLSPIQGAVAMAHQTTRRMRFSAREARFVSTAIHASERISTWGKEKELTPLEVFRYYDEAGDAGVDGAILSLVAHRTQRKREGKEGSRELIPARVARLVEAWFDERDRLIDPPPLISGQDVIELLQARPGPQIGELLRCVREAQVRGMVNTREEAIKYLNAKMKADTQGS